MKSHLLARLCVVLIFTVCASIAVARTWTDSAGTHKIEGEFVKLADGKVEIRRDDGTLLRVALEKLSDEDRKYVRKLATPPDKTPFSVAGDDEAKTSAHPKGPVAGGDTQTVFAEGVGTTKEEALKDAFRAAVRQVVGEVVDGETIVKNEELVKDQVLTYSDGFIPEHKVTSEKHENGLFRVGIRAKVQRRSVIMKLKAANITLKSLDGQSLYGRIVTEIGAEKDAAALVSKALGGFPDQFIEAHVVGEPKTPTKTDSEATLVVNVEFTPSLVAYKSFASKLCQTLDGICKTKGEFTSVVPEGSDRRGGGRYFYIPAGTFAATAAKWMPELWEGNVGPYHRWQWQSKGFAFVVATLVSTDSSRVNWNYYVLDEAVGHVVLRATSRQATCKVAFLDANDQPVVIDRFVPKNNHFIKQKTGNEEYECANSWRYFLRVLYNGGLTSMADRGNWEPRLPAPAPTWRDNLGSMANGGNWEPRLAFVAPLFFGFDFGGHGAEWSGFCYVPIFTERREVKLSLGDLKKVTTVKCELTFRDVNDANKAKEGRRRNGGGGMF